jgi:hypothetical protein
VLGRLGRFAEARAELEDLPGDLSERSRQESHRAQFPGHLFAVQGDLEEAVTQARRALALREHLPDPRDRAISHNNLANYLLNRGAPPDRAEAPRHQLAALLYRLVSGLGQDLQTSLHNYAVNFRRARAAGAPLTVPRLADLLADPPSTPWLTGSNSGRRT